MIIPTYHGVKAMDPDGFFYFEGQSSTESEVMNYRTDYAVGSVILSTGEDTDGKVSLFLLSLDSSNRKYWKKIL